MNSLKQQFQLTALAIAFLLLILGVFTYVTLQRSGRNQQLLQAIDQLAYLEVQMGKAERDFIAIESVNSFFFQTGESPYIRTMDSLSKENHQLILQLHAHPIITHLHLVSELQQLQRHYEQIESLFSDLTQTLRQYGFEGYGLSGRMRTHIHQVEQALEGLNHYQLTSLMLTLRRHEKDFMLRKDPRYIDRFNQTMTSFIQRMEQLNINSGLIPKALAYQATFQELAQKSIQIGSSAQQGLLFDLNQEFLAVSPILGNLHHQISQYSRRQIAYSAMALVLAFVLLPLAIIVIYFRISGRITRNLVSLQRYITRLGHGELPEQIPSASQDEIGQMIGSINELTLNLKNTRNFALEVGKGNFDTQINVFGNRGDLGGSLILMRQQLQEVAQKQIQQRIEETQRSWAAEGALRFAQLLRSNHAQLQILEQEFIRNLVQYMGLNQGGLLVMETQEELVLKACFAYDRQKYLHKSLHPHEGLLGACVQEKESIYMTQLPGDYISITSGLGHASPDCLLIVPMIHENQVLGIIELAGFGKIETFKRQFAEKIAESMAAQLATWQNNARISSMLQQQELLSQNLRQQEEELRQHMEEMQASQEESQKTIAELQTRLQQLQGTHSLHELIAKQEVPELEARFCMLEAAY